MIKTIEELYPLTIVCDRYGGTYSGGKYTAWYCDPWDVPLGVEECDPLCDIFWRNNTDPVGLGATPQAAMEDLRIKLNEYNDKMHKELGIK